MPEDPQDVPSQTPAGLLASIAGTSNLNEVINALMRQVDRQMVIPSYLFGPGPRDEVIPMPPPPPRGVIIPRAATMWWSETVRELHRMVGRHWRFNPDAVISFDFGQRNPPDIIRQSTWDYLSMSEVRYVDLDIVAGIGEVTRITGRSYCAQRARPTQARFTTTIHWQAYLADYGQVTGDSDVIDITVTQFNIEHERNPVWMNPLDMPHIAQPVRENAFPTWAQGAGAEIGRRFAEGLAVPRAPIYDTPPPPVDETVRYTGFIYGANGDPWPLQNIRFDFADIQDNWLEGPTPEVAPPVRDDEFTPVNIGVDFGVALTRQQQGNRAQRRARRFNHQFEGRHRRRMQETLDMLAERYQEQNPGDVIGTLPDGSPMTMADFVRACEELATQGTAIMREVASGFVALTEAVARWGAEFNLALQRIEAAAPPKTPTPTSIARDLLLSHLSAEQAAMYRETDYFFIFLGIPSGYVDKSTGADFWWYRIDSSGNSHNIREYAPRNGQMLASYCVHPSDTSLPQPDVMLAQKFMIEHSHSEFLKTANMSDYHDHSKGPRRTISERLVKLNGKAAPIQWVKFRDNPIPKMYDAHGNVEADFSAALRITNVHRPAPNTYIDTLRRIGR